MCLCGGEGLGLGGGGGWWGGVEGRREVGAVKESGRKVDFIRR